MAHGTNDASVIMQKIYDWQVFDWQLNDWRIQRYLFFLDLSKAWKNYFVFLLPVVTLNQPERCGLEIANYFSWK